MFIKITSIAPLPDYILLIGFTTGEYKLFDLKPIIDKYSPFQALINTPGLYKQAKIDVGGYGIVWNDQLDISSEGLYERGIQCNADVNIDNQKKYSN